MAGKNYKISSMTRADIDVAISWAEKEGWNPGLYDADCFYAADPSGFFIGLLNGTPISCISAVAYDENFGFLGFYIVKPEYRKKGYGMQIWKRALSYLKTRNIGLDGVMSQHENYKKSGFKFAYKNIRYRFIKNKSFKEFPDIVSLSDLDFKELAAYDDSLYPAKRHRFLKCWVSQPNSLAIGALQNKKLVGYGVIRKCRVGYKIGPLFAGNSETATKIFQALTIFTPIHSEIFLDVPEVNSGAMKLAERYEMNKIFETARMYTKNQPNILLNKVFGVTSFELG